MIGKEFIAAEGCRDVEGEALERVHGNVYRNGKQPDVALLKE